MPSISNVLAFATAALAVVTPGDGLQLPFISTSNNAASHSGEASSTEHRLLSSEFHSFADGLLKDWGVPGLAVGVIKLGAPGEDVKVEFGSYGTAGRTRNITENTLFGIASNSKLLTSASLGILHDRGLFNWTQKVSDLLPEFGLADPVANSLANVRDILAHRTGMPRHEASYQPHESLVELVGRIKYLKPSAEFRETWQYNNQMFVTGSLLASRLSESPFTSFVESSIFQPLNMTSSTYHPSLVPDSPLSDSFVTMGNKTVVEIPYTFGGLSREDLETNAGAGGAVSSTRDLVKWMELLLTQANTTANSTTPFSNIITSDAIGEIIQIQTPQERSSQYPDRAPIQYALGLMETHYQGVQLFFHGGGIPGAGSQIFWSPQHGVGVVALTNVMGPGNSVSDIVCYRAFEDLLGLTRIDWDARYKEKAAIRTRKEQDHRREVTSPQLLLPTPAEIAEFVGNYTDPGYGSVKLCPAAHLPTITPECTAYLERVAATLPITPTVTPSYYLIAPGFFSQAHLALVGPIPGVEKNTFSTVPGLIYGPTREREEELLEYQWGTRGEVKFVQGSEGWEMHVWGVWGEGPDVPRSEGPEVVFKKKVSKGWHLEL